MAQTSVDIRNKLSELLFEHKQTMNENTYKLLYECLAEEVKQADKVWCTITYAKATVQFDEDEIIPQLNIHRRNVLLSQEAIGKTEAALNKHTSRTCTFYHTVPFDDTSAKDCLSVEMDEPNLFNSKEAEFCIINVKRIEQ